MGRGEFVEKCSTGIEGLDDILRGGFSRNRFYLIEGEPGTGKTTLALQFLLEGVKKGERSLYITLSETEEELTEVATSHGWSLDDLDTFELSTIEEKFVADSQNTLFHPAEVELGQTTQILLDEIERVQPVRLVLDSLSELRLLAQNSLRFRRQLLALKQFFASKRCTVLFLDDMTSDQLDLQVESIAHGVVRLHQMSPEYGAERRRLTVTKFRGVPFRGGNHDYTIKRGGIQVFPRLVAAEHRTGRSEARLSSGVSELDQLVGGGVDGGTSTLIIGPSGCGKSTLAIQFAVAAAERGEYTALFSFDESLQTLELRTDGLHMPLARHVREGRIGIVPVDPAELSPGEFSYRIREQVEEKGAKIVIIDSLNGYLQAMPAERYLIPHLHELLSYLGQKGVASMLLFAQHGLFGVMQAQIDLTYLADTILLLRYFEHRGSVQRAISAVKKRSGFHESTIRRYSLGNGVHIGEPLDDFHGILTGMPTSLGGSEKAGG